MNRLKWIKQNLLPDLVESLQKREQISMDSDQLFATVINADPSRNKSAVQWLIKTYVNGGFLWEDIKGGSTSKVSETLSLFGKYKKNLSVDQKNIYKYRTLASLYSSVRPYVLAQLETDDKNISLQGRELKRWEKQKALDETHILFENDRLKIVIPLTKRASQWWGQGTRWCTAAREHNQFAYYNNKAPLFIMLFRDHQNKERRLQLWISHDNHQLMDETDAQVDEEFVKQNWNSFEKILNYGASVKGLLLKYIPSKFRTNNICQKAITHSGSALKHVPEKNITYELCKLACEKIGQALYFVPERFKTKDLCWIAIQQNGEALNYVPGEFKDQELCQQAVEQNPLAFPYVPEEFQTYEFCKQACKNYGITLCLIPIEFKTQKLCEIAVTTHGQALRYVPKNIISYDLCKQAVEKSGYALDYVPDEFKNEELCKIACGKNGYALNYVPEYYKTKEIINHAVQQNAGSLRYVPKELKTQELCWIACEQTGQALYFVPEQFKTLELCCMAFKKDPSVLRYMPLEIQTRPEIIDILTSYQSIESCSKPEWSLSEVIEKFDQYTKDTHCNFSILPQV